MTRMTFGLVRYRTLAVRATSKTVARGGRLGASKGHDSRTRTLTRPLEVRVTETARVKQPQARRAA
jgi:hypothetical protein